MASPSSPSRPRALALLAIAATIAAGGCGGGSSKAAPAAVPGATTTTDASNTTQGPEVSPAGDIPDNQAFVSYAPPGAAYSVQVPEGWARAQAGAATVFRDKYNSVRLESRQLATAPTTATVQRTDVPRLVHATDVAVRAVPRRPGTAVLATYQVPSPPDAVTGKSVTLAVERYAFWHNGTEVIVTLSAPVGSDNVDPWRTITDSLTWK